MEERVVILPVFSGACLLSNDDKVELKYDASKLRSKCSKFEKAAASAISFLKSVKLILFKGRNVKENFCAIGFWMSRSI